MQQCVCLKKIPLFLKLSSVLFCNGFSISLSSTDRLISLCVKLFNGFNNKNRAINDTNAIKNSQKLTQQKKQSNIRISEISLITSDKNNNNLEINLVNILLCIIFSLTPTISNQCDLIS